MITLDFEGKIQIPQSTLNDLGWKLGEPLTYVIFGNRMTLYPTVSLSAPPPCRHSILSLFRLVFY